uniref:Uncharacterized protein n=1 Tax=Chromera velia CCMP2878 TaxID=1169474 RepID=A0A0G4HC78_9ALVE|eukprot:Cvel_6219.t1-p1 / transcript=Cvel_6219.t1 / gene=Cvel_6219 / organism=Chromera_velia_CCMP2878 / gene_product=hypothetical protein / transcript_product=hypothetical protein / location=Cvel_scaffold301:6931-7413(+) / protein_length=161 / sequence_SO=supercontig / SO=protein_coding / is_pseudo=false
MAPPLCMSLRTVASQALPIAVPVRKALLAGRIPTHFVPQRPKLSIPLTGFDESFSRSRHRPDECIRSGSIPVSDIISIENGVPVGASGVDYGLSGRTVLSFHPLMTVIVLTGGSRGIGPRRAPPIGAPSAIPLAGTPSSTALPPMIRVAPALPARVRGLSS